VAAMRGERRPVSPEELYPRRLAVRVLELVLEQLRMNEVALRFNGDDPQQVFPGTEGTLRFYEDGGWDEGRRPLAVVRVDLERSNARVVVERLRELVRTKHRAEFRLEDVGIAPEPGEADLDMEIDLSGIIDEWESMRMTPQQRVISRPRRAGHYRRYAGALGRGR